MIPWINMGDRSARIDIQRVEEHYAEASGGKVLYVGDLSIRERFGNYSNDPYPIFWQEKTVKPEHSHYFGLTFNRFSGGLAIFDGSSAAEGEWFGLMHKQTGEIIFSRAGHDYRKTRDGSIMVDGGRDRSRSGGNGYPVRMKIVEHRMVIVHIGDRLEKEDQ